MSLSTEQIKKIAHLARLTIPDDQVERLKKDLDNILSLVTKMNELDTGSIAPLAHPLEEKQPLRADQITEINQRELFQKIAPYTNAGLYIVPKVIEGE